MPRKSHFAAFYFFSLVFLLCSCSGRLGAPLGGGPQSFNIQSVPIPELDRWETQMEKYGKITGDLIRSHTEQNEIDPALAACYYDCARVFYNIADYTGDSSWLTYLPAARKAYRDNYVIPNNGGVPGYWNFTHGLRIDFERQSTAASRNAVELLSKNASYAADVTPLEWTANSALSREVAYAVMSYIDAELVGFPHRNRLDSLFLQALNHIDGWFIRNEEPNWGPFMFALTAEALIYYWDHINRDPRILQKIKFGADQIWNQAWVEEDESFFYRKLDDPNNGAPDLNMLIAPVYSWLFLQTRDVKYRERGDQIFAGGVRGAYLGGAKQFNQNYRWSFDYVKWRKQVEGN